MCTGLTGLPCGLHLIIGTELQLSDGPKLILLVENEQGYGNLSQLITIGRRNAEKGDYHLTRTDLEQGLEGCIAILIPDHSTFCHEPTTISPSPLRGGSG